MNEHRPVFLGDGDGDLALEVEMVLAADNHGAFEPMWCCIEDRAGSAARHSAAGQDITFGSERCADVEDRRQFLIGDARALSGFSCLQLGVGGYCE